MFDIFYIGENTKLKEDFPFAKQVSNIDEVLSNTKMYWLVEPNIEITDPDIFDYRPETYDTYYEHIWKWDSNNYGGVRLIPKKTNDGIKEVNRIVCKKTFHKLNTKTPGKYFDKNVFATHVWCIDKEYKLNDNINWAPDNFEPTFIHSFHLKGQLEHKYPEKEGGVKLYPKDWKEAEIKYHNFLDANVVYPVLYLKDPSDFTQRDTLKDEYVWIVDTEYKTNKKSFDWVPNPFEGDYIHNFRMPYQLTEKYPLEMGGINLVPIDWKNAKVKIHRTCPVRDVQYDVFYIKHTEFNEKIYLKYIEESTTEWLWVIDEDLKYINGDWTYVPKVWEQEYIHVFKLPGHLDERYLLDCDEPWDLRCGGVRLLHKNFDITKHKYQQDIVPVRYDIYFTADITDYQTFARKSRTDAFWLVDKEHVISEVFRWIPLNSEQQYINIFKLPNQLDHKYPRGITNVSDNRAGGIKLVPKNFNKDELKYQGLLTDIEIVEYEKFSSEEEGRANTKHDWFWVVDPDVTVLEDFNFDFIPDTWDNGKTHVWQKLNPITNRQYDYSGVMLCPKVAQTKGRPKYLREASCTQNTYPVYYLQADDYKSGLQSVYERLSEQTTGNMYWVVDAFTQLDPNFKFDYYPTQWDQKYIHVFLNEDNAFTSVRLVPKSLFIDNTYTDKEIANNSFKNLKQINTIASQRPLWPMLDLINQYPVHHLQPDDYKDDLNDVYARLSSNATTDMFWVVDAFTVLNKDFNFEYYPAKEEKKYVHVFADQDGKYKNVRLMPRKTFLEKNYTDGEIANNSFEHLKQINTIASLKPKWPVIHLQSLEKTEFTNAIKDIETPFVWTVDPDVKVDQKVLDNGFMPNILDINKIHTWQKLNPTTKKVHAYGGLRLWPTGIDHSNIKSNDLKLNRIKNIQYVKEVGSTTNTYDIIYLSYHEPNANRGFQKLQDHIRSNNISINLLWVRDVKGIFNAHKQGASMVSSKMFWVVDADAEITKDFLFDYIPDVYDQDVVHVWASSNPITQDEYGYGGVKLFPTEMVRDATSWGLDFTTGLSSRFKSMPQVSCVTRFNTDAFSTWRSAFRECVKLTLNDDAESNQRLDKWLNTRGEEKFSADACDGALAGNSFAKANKDNLAELDKINDFNWLEAQWKQ